MWIGDRMKKGPRYVAVIWLDAWKSAGLDISVANVAEHHKPATMETRGWLLKQDDVGVTLANECCLDDDDDDFRGPTFIPAKMVKSVEDYPPKKIRKPRLHAEKPPDQ